MKPRPQYPRAYTKLDVDLLCSDNCEDTRKLANFAETICCQAQHDAIRVLHNGSAQRVLDQDAPL